MIQVHNLTYYYRGSKQPVLENVSATFKRGEISAVVGANGQGKSTLANILAGLFPLRDKSANQLDTGGASVGIVFQNPSVQILFDTVQEEIAFVLENHQVPSDTHAKRIALALKKVGLSGSEQENPLHFSLGMKQRVAIATVLALDPDFIIFDEATAMLDAKAKHAMLQIFQDLAEGGTGVVMVTNIIDELLLADSVLFLSNDSHHHLTSPVYKNIVKAAELLTKSGFELTPLWQLCQLTSEGHSTARNAVELISSPLLERFKTRLNAKFKGTKSKNRVLDDA